MYKYLNSPTMKKKTKTPESNSNIHIPIQSLYLQHLKIILILYQCDDISEKKFMKIQEVQKFEVSKFKAV